jgi:hypothetical protein
MEIVDRVLESRGLRAVGVEEPESDEGLRKKSGELELERALGRSVDDGPELEPVDTKATDAAWDGSASRFTDEQYARSAILDRAKCGEQWSDKPAKQRYSLPIREPGGGLNKNAVHAAAARINQVQACPAAVSSAKNALRRAYGEIGETPPDSVKSLIGWKETSVADGEGDAKRPEKGRQSTDSLRRTADMQLLEHALGRRVQDGPKLEEPDPEPAPEPAPERELRKEADALALELALGGSDDDSQ